MSQLNRTTYDPVEKIWRGPNQQPLFNPNIGLGDIILRVLTNTPNRVTQISADTGRELTCKEIRSKSIRVAENLKKHGIKFGDVVSIAARNTWDLAPVVFGCLVNGVIVNTLDAMFGVSDLTHMFKLVKPTLVFCEELNRQVVEEALNKCGNIARIFLFDKSSKTNEMENGVNRGNTEHKINYVSDLFHPIDLDEETYVAPIIPDTTKHIAGILCSSGTTGLSKGVCLSHALCIAMLQNMWPFPATGELVFLCFSSLYWVSGFGGLIYGTLNGAVRIITTDSFDPDLQLNLIEKYKVTLTMAPPSHYAQMLSSNVIETVDLSSLKYVGAGGSFVADSIRIGFKKYLKHGDVYVAYGMTEICGLSHVTYPDNKLSSTGILKPMMEMKIINETGQSLGPNKEGEICLRPPYPFLGYFGNEEQTKEVLSSDGWINTGDIGRVDLDGELYFVERKKDMIRYLGYTSAPCEIEEVIQTVTGLQQICVVGIEDLQHGNDLPAALIVKPDSCHLKEGDVVTLVNEKLPDYKKLHGGVYFIEKLPLTHSGKVKRKDAKVTATKLYLAKNSLRSCDKLDN